MSNVGPETSSGYIEIDPNDPMVSIATKIDIIANNQFTISLMNAHPDEDWSDTPSVEQLRVDNVKMWADIMASARQGIVSRQMVQLQRLKDAEQASLDEPNS